MPEADKILVVDDEAIIRDLLSEVLLDDGYAVVTASDGPQALEILRGSHDFVILFTDIMMPEMDGIALVREARRVRPTIIPIVMTAYATLESARAAVKEGAYDYVLKPFSLSEIKLAVTNALERHRLANENARLLALTELFKISEHIATMHDEQRLLDFVLKATLERLNADRGSIMVVTDEGRALEIRASVGLPPEVVQHPIEVGKSIAGWVAQHGRPLLVRHINDNPEMAQMSRRLEEPSFVSVPLERKSPLDQGGQGVQDDHNVVGVLNVCRKRDGSPFSEGDLKVLSIVANHAAAALQNVRLIRDIQASHISTIESMVLLLEARDPYTRHHSQRVRDLCVSIARMQGASPEDIEVLRLGATFHDIGKVGVPDGVLNKAGPLDESEWALIKKHPLIGYGVLEPVRFMKSPHLEVVRSHHERLDGTGYPDGLKGKEISPSVRIIAAADAYDAMSGDRAYRKALSPDQIVTELKQAAGSQLDAGVVKILIHLIETGKINAIYAR